jgi:hypothetical protein
VREDGRIVGGEVWEERVCNREEWKKLLRTARNCRILHMALEYKWNGITFITAVVLLDGSSPSISRDETNKYKYTQTKQYKKTIKTI